MDSISRLRSLLGIVEDRSVVDDVSERVAEPDRRAADIAEVLPQAIASANHSGRLTRALQSPIESTLRRSITENPKDFADVLFPVMGPAIRRSISEALRSALEGLNQALQLGFSRQGLKWRFESWRTGVPFREVVLRHTLLYRVKEAFLIHRSDGLLIARAGDETPGAMDRDAVAAMLTAIEDFVADSTGSEDDEGELSSAEFGGRVLWVISGYAARLALIMEGTPPLSLRIKLRDRLAFLHQHYGTWMESFDGNQDEVPHPIQEELARCLLFESSESGTGGVTRRIGAAITVLTILLLAAAAFWLWSYQKEQVQVRRWTALEVLIDQTPGLVWLKADRSNNPAKLSVLADPVAEAPQPLAAKAGFSDEELAWDVQPFLSAEPAIELRRLERALGPIPTSVSSEIHDRKLWIGGSTDPDWISALQAYLARHPDTTMIDISNLAVEEKLSLAAQLAKILSPPNTVRISESAPMAVAVTGTGDYHWQDQAKKILDRDFSSLAVNWDGFQSSQLRRLYDISVSLREMMILFSEDLVPEALNPADLDQTAALLREAQSTASQCPCTLAAKVIGCTDEVGTDPHNSQLRLKRAQWLKDELVNRKVSSDLLQVDGSCGDSSPALRSAYVDLTIESQ